MLLTVFGGLVVGVVAAMVLPMAVLAAKSKNSRRAAIFITVDFLVVFTGIAVNHFFPHWGDATGGYSDSDGRVFLAVVLVAGIVTYFVARRLHYLDRARRWLAGPTGAQSDNSPIAN